MGTKEDAQCDREKGFDHDDLRDSCVDSDVCISRWQLYGEHYTSYDDIVAKHLDAAADMRGDMVSSIHRRTVVPTLKIPNY